MNLDTMEGVEVPGSQGGSTSRKGPASEEWRARKAMIVHLFITQDLTLEDVKLQMDRLGFIAT